jgi:IclR family acetate operon transcriptional repressor
VTVDFVLSDNLVQSIAHVGRPSVGYATATGKVMLAFTGAEPAPGSMTAFTKRTITNRERLAAELQRIRRVGWAEAIGEREEHLNAIAAPVYGASGELAAIMGVQGPAQRFTREAMRAALQPLRERTDAVSALLGWVTPDCPQSTGDR